MVSVEFEGDYPPLRQNTGSELSRNAILRGVRVPVFWFGTSKSSDGDHCLDFLYAGEKQSLLDSLLVAQWEDCALKGLLRYDVTSCETKVIDGGKYFVALLNENWNLNSFTKYENKIQHSGCHKFNYVKSDIEELLFCIEIGDKEDPELVSSATVPKDGIFIVINACYFPNPLPVEVMPLIPFFGEGKGIQIFELGDCPIKTLVFSGKKLKSLIDMISEICSHLEKQDMPFNLVMSECGAKILLFPQIAGTSQPGNVEGASYSQSWLILI